MKRGLLKSLMAVITLSLVGNIGFAVDQANANLSSTTDNVGRDGHSSSDMMDRDREYIDRSEASTDAERAAKEDKRAERRAGMHDGMHAAKSDFLKSQTIEFRPNSHELTDRSRQQLRDLITSTGAHQDDYTIRIAAWSDQPFPGRDQDLPQEAQDLAKRRLDQVKNFIESNYEVKADIETFNMAEDSNWLAELFNTEEAELKSVFSARERAGDKVEKEYRVFKREGGPQKAVLVIKKPESKS